MSNAQRARGGARRRPTRRAPTQVVVDLAGLEFIDSTGLRSLVRFHQLDHAETEIVCRNAGGQVAEVLEITGLGSVLELEATSG